MAEQVNAGNTAQRARAIAQPVAESLGLTLWDVRYLKEGALWYLRFWIDKPDGGGQRNFVTLDDCEALSRAIEKPLDDADFIAQQYYLEVCSPGIERELTRDEHFAQYLGSVVTAKLTHPSQEITGVLVQYENKQLTLQPEDGEAVTVAKKTCAWVKLYDDFEEDDYNDNEMIS